MIPNNKTMDTSKTTTTKPLIRQRRHTTGNSKLKETKSNTTRNYDNSNNANDDNNSDNTKYRRRNKQYNEKVEKKHRHHHHHHHQHKNNDNQQQGRQQQQQYQYQYQYQYQHHQQESYQRTITQLLKNRTIIGIGILIISIGIAQLLNYSYHHHSSQNTSSSLSTIEIFINTICNSTIESYCHPLLVTDTYRRTQYITTQQSSSKKTKINKKNYIKTNETIIRIPESIILYDIHSINDRWIQSNILVPLYLSSTISSNATNATTSTTNNNNNIVYTLSPASYFAIYLVRRKQKLVQQQLQQETTGNGTSSSSSASSSNNNNHSTTTKSSTDNTISTIVQQYLLHILPSYNDYKFVYNHPVTWTNDELLYYFTSSVLVYTQNNPQSLSSYATLSSSYYHICAVRTMIRTEYDTFYNISKQFQKDISYTEYVTARLNIVTRSFGTGPYSKRQQQQKHTTILNESANHHNKTNNTTTTSTDNDDESLILTTIVSKLIKQIYVQGSYAMVPILDLYNHHGNPNVQFTYQSSQSTIATANATDTTTVATDTQLKHSTSNNYGNNNFFIVTATRNIHPGYEIWDSYGKRTYSDLFARYGFINTDNTDYTQCSIAIHHNQYIDYIQNNNYYYNNNNNDANTDDSSSSSRKGSNNDDDDDDDDDDTGKPNNYYHTDTHYSLEYKFRIAQYILYDDGYENCIYPPTIVSNNVNEDTDRNKSKNDISWELKRMKFQFLLHRSKLFRHWVAVFPPKNKLQLPHKQSRLILSTTTTTTTDTTASTESSASSSSSSTSQKQQQQKQQQQQKVDAQYVFSTCRVIVLTEYDYDGNALLLLSNNLYNTTFVLPRNASSSLEYRTLLCIARLVRTVLSKFPYKTINEVQQRISKLDTELNNINTNNNNSSSNSNNNKNDNTTLQIQLIINQLYLGEMESLETLKQLAFSQIRQQSHFVQQMELSKAQQQQQQRQKEDMATYRSSSSSEYFMRNERCSIDKDYLLALVQG